MLLKIKNWIFRTNSATYKKNVEEQNCSFQKDVQSYFDHFLIGIIVFLINMKNAIK